MYCADFGLAAPMLSGLEVDSLRHETAHDPIALDGTQSDAGLPPLSLFVPPEDQLIRPLP